eukprot:2325916-Rhodomonas_salina.1
MSETRLCAFDGASRRGKATAACSDMPCRRRRVDASTRGLLLSLCQKKCLVVRRARFLLLLCRGCAAVGAHTLLLREVTSSHEEE